MQYPGQVIAAPVVRPGVIDLPTMMNMMMMLMFFLIMFSVIKGIIPTS